jgi:hypothetical protein
MARSHAEILADIAAQVVQEHRQYTLHPSGSTTNPDEGNVPVPIGGDTDPAGTPIEWWYGYDVPVHDSWNYTLPEEYQA